jgi:cytochrome c-type biogenesis protein CcmH
MTLWFGLALMTAVAVLAVLWPLARRTGNLRSGSDVAVYRDQLEEIERDRASGLIPDQEAASAQVEVSRRLLAAAEAPPPPQASANVATWRRRAVALVALLALPLGAAGLYLALGSPWLPDQPLAPRLAAARGDQSFEGLVAQVETHLDRNPEDGRGWEVIAPIYLRLGRFDEAVKARRQALRLNGDTAERESALGEALVFAANGMVTAEAKAAFEKAVSLDASDVPARYFLGPCRRAGWQPRTSRRDVANVDRGRSARRALGRVHPKRAGPCRRRAAPGDRGASRLKAAAQAAALTKTRSQPLRRWTRSNARP